MDPDSKAAKQLKQDCKRHQKKSAKKDKTLMKQLFGKLESDPRSERAFVETEENFGNPLLDKMGINPFGKNMENMGNMMPKMNQDGTEPGNLHDFFGANARRKKEMFEVEDNFGIKVLMKIVDSTVAVFEQATRIFCKRRKQA